MCNSSDGYVFAYQFDQADRLRKSLRVADMGVQEIADALGVSRNTVGNWISGRALPNTEQLIVWAGFTGAPHKWLIDGQVPGKHCGNPT